MTPAASSVLTGILLATLAAAHGNNAPGHIQHARQVSPSLGFTATTVISLTDTIITTYTLPPTVSYSLVATNPTAVPLSLIQPGAPSQATVPLSTTFTAGATQTFVPAAPPLPDGASIISTNYPTMDRTPLTNSTEVLGWIQDVQNSGVTIPNITATVEGGCPSNPDIVDDTSRCWWTCGGCHAPTDIVSCPVKMNWGLTYDDGPSPYTPNLLQYLEANDLHATFFSIGSRALELPDVLQYEYMTGHQISVHTWSHPYMTTLTNEEIIAELGWTKKLMKDLLGVTPNTWRPPYGDVDNRVRAIAQAMGLTTIIWTSLSPTTSFDTFDYNVEGDLVSASEVLGNFSVIAQNATTMSTGFILLEHDLFQVTVDLATGYILPDALAYQPPFTIKPVIECLNMPLSNAYIETNDNTTNPPAESGQPAPTTFSNSAAYTSTSSASAAASTSESTTTSHANPKSTSGSLPIMNEFSLVGALLGAVACLGPTLGMLY